MTSKSFWDTGLGKFLNIITFGIPRIVQGISQPSRNNDGSSNTAAGVFNQQNWQNTAGDILLGDDYQNNQPLGQQLFGTNIGGLIQSLTNRITANQLTGAEREANAFSAEQAQLDRDFQERMSSTQYQRGVADMRAAGVNPALAIGQGGAAAPSGQAASSVNPQGSAFNLGDIFQLMMMKPQVELMRSQGQAVVTNAEANRISAEAHAKDADTRRLEYENVTQPLALNRIKVGDSVVSLNEAQTKKVSKEIALLNEDITLAKLQQMATSLDIAWKGETWEDSRKLLAANIAKATAEKVYTYALAGKTSAEKTKILQENSWEKIYYDYWSNPANSDRGVNLEMLKGSNLTGAGIAYLQALGDNLQNREPGRQEQNPPYEHENLGR